MYLSKPTSQIPNGTWKAILAPFSILRHQASIEWSKTHRQDLGQYPCQRGGLLLAWHTSNDWHPSSKHQDTCIQVDSRRLWSCSNFPHFFQLWRPLRRPYFCPNPVQIPRHSQRNNIRAQSSKAHCESLREALCHLKEKRRRTCEILPYNPQRNQHSFVHHLPGSHAV